MRFYKVSRLIAGQVVILTIAAPADAGRHAISLLADKAARRMREEAAGTAEGHDEVAGST